jgi:TPR repeat protein
MNGDGVPANPVLSAQFLQAFANQGKAEAPFSSGKSFSFGKGIAMDRPAAGLYWKRSVDQGHRETQFHWAFAFYSGNRVPQNFRNAAHNSIME